MLPENVDELTFSSTHLKYVDHGQDAEYAMEARKRLGYQAVSPHSKTDPFENVKKTNLRSLMIQKNDIDQERRKPA